MIVTGGENAYSTEVGTRWRPAPRSMRSRSSAAGKILKRALHQPHWASQQVQVSGS
jgi:hypothetical protein